ncbi:putative orotidine-5'-phosphate decarboxylase [Kockovaella imperatae]|uniref:Orotidine 5'-phosphate decarboxylase n=1 Tax=Kockovaella imperatae TaxID=4999 RepID=A0A1Y1UHK0_9TREE|nr:putative orotidine-5'-phosphate decarboxylase [Kockovaella imperatae]ORX37533.1 putative orotidine-5'-phosphate decarboxylase [Kockovaella imperatae]
MSVHPTTLKTYGSRVSLHSNPTAKRLLEIMERKQSNLCVSIDVTNTAEVLEIVRGVGSKVCMVKTHADIISDFSSAFADELVRFSKELDFIIFEDRKFADIGNTVVHQYQSGPLAIASWAHLTNAHPIPGPGIITGLSSVGLPLGRALLLLGEMSSKGNLATGEYTKKTMQMAKEAGREFVVGFIAMSRVDPEEEEDWLMLTPGVGLVQGGDKMGQQYRTPRDVILDSGCDVIIVGRGIYGVKGGKDAMEAEAEKYRRAGWEAYEERLKRT